jgi:hypothetical protein
VSHGRSTHTKYPPSGRVSRTSRGKCRVTESISASFCRFYNRRSSLLHALGVLPTKPIERVKLKGLLGDQRLVYPTIPFEPNKPGAAVRAWLDFQHLRALIGQSSAHELGQRLRALCQWHQKI